MKCLVITAFFTLSLLPFAARANDPAKCQVVTDRTPCSDKVKEEVYKPYAGKNPTTDNKDKATTAEECSKIGTDSVTIVRRDLIRKKVVKVMWEGKEIATKDDNSNCKKAKKK